MAEGPHSMTNCIKEWQHWEGLGGRVIGMTGCFPPVRLQQPLFSCSVRKPVRPPERTCRDRDEAQFQIYGPLCTSPWFNPQQCFLKEACGLQKASELQRVKHCKTGQ